MQWAAFPSFANPRLGTLPKTEKIGRRNYLSIAPCLSSTPSGKFPVSSYFADCSDKVVAVDIAPHVLPLEEDLPENLVLQVDNVNERYAPSMPAHASDVP